LVKTLPAGETTPFFGPSRLIDFELKPTLRPFNVTDGNDSYVRPKIIFFSEYGSIE
jgi:hypothetical protein